MVNISGPLPAQGNTAECHESCQQHHGPAVRGRGGGGETRMHPWAHRIPLRGVRAPNEHADVPEHQHTWQETHLLSSHCPPEARALGERDPENLPHYGQVHEMQKKFLKKSSNSPHRPRASRKNVHVPIVVGNVGQNPSMYSDTKPSPHHPVNRPLSWESPHVADSVPIIESERSDSLPPPSLDDDSSNTEGSSIGFRCHSNIRTPFHQKPPLSPTPLFRKPQCLKMITRVGTTEKMWNLRYNPRSARSPWETPPRCWTKYWSSRSLKRISHLREGPGPALGDEGLHPDPPTLIQAEN